jgi:hypothetical protein
MAQLVLQHTERWPLVVGGCVLLDIVTEGQVLRSERNEHLHHKILVTQRGIQVPQAAVQLTKLLEQRRNALRWLLLDGANLVLHRRLTQD